MFIALNFDESVKGQIREIIRIVEAKAAEGRFVPDRQLHLTVEFLGEVSGGRVGLIQEAMDGINCKPFTLALAGVGRFKRGEGDIYWLGLKEQAALYQMQRNLLRRLSDLGFALEDRAFRPHITLGRKVRLQDGFDTETVRRLAEKIEIRVRRVDLMKTDFINGQAHYSVVYSRPL